VLESLPNPVLKTSAVLALPETWCGGLKVLAGVESVMEPVKESRAGLKVRPLGDEWRGEDR
jgi:hypothetical protein